MTFQIQRARERYFGDHGWLQTYHSFSFADYYDPNNLHWGALRVFNDDYIAPGAGFPAHPHRDMEILTYVFSGELEHQDSMGNRGVVKAGGVQFMSAGTGVQHSEYNARKDLPLHLAQMWVLPGKNGSAPTYGQVEFTPEQSAGRWLTIASGRPRIEAPVKLTQDAVMRVAEVRRAPLDCELETDRKAFLFVGEGAVEANGDKLEAGDAVRIGGIDNVRLQGEGRVILWDLPEVE